VYLILIPLLYLTNFTYLSF